jgi:hypothetical protein
MSGENLQTGHTSLLILAPDFSLSTQLTKVATYKYTLNASEIAFLYCTIR